MRSKVLKTLILVLFLIYEGSLLAGQNGSEDSIRIHFKHDSYQLSGWCFKAEGIGPFPTIILLQGSVGKNGDVLNLGKNLSREGFNVMTYNYPGTWESEGTRTDEAALSSIQSAINHVKSDHFIHTFNSDTANIILAGYSYGGGMSLLASVFNPAIKKVISIAGGDLSVLAEKLETTPALKEAFVRMVDQVLANPTMARGTSGEAYVELLLQNKSKYNLKKHAEKLANKELLLIGGWQDNLKKMEEELLPLYRTLLSKGADKIKIQALETGHNFVKVEDQLAQTIAVWLTNM